MDGGVIDSSLVELRVFDAVFDRDHLYLAAVQGGVPFVEVVARAESDPTELWVSQRRVEFGLLTLPPAQFRFVAGADGRADPNRIQLGPETIAWTTAPDQRADSAAGGAKNPTDARSVTPNAAAEAGTVDTETDATGPIPHVRPSDAGGTPTRWLTVLAGGAALAVALWGFRKVADRS